MSSDPPPSDPLDVRYRARGALAGVACGALAWLGFTQVFNGAYVVLGALPGALVLPGVWAWRSAARPALWRDLVFVAIPFANGPITVVLAWLLGALFGPRGGVLSHGGGLFGGIFLSMLACVQFAPILLPAGVLTAGVVRLFASRRLSSL